VHANAPLTAEGRRRLVARVLDEGRPQAHVAAESHLARATVRKWVTRFLGGGEQALSDRSSRPHRSPTRTDPAVVARVEALRRDRKLPPRLIVEELAGDGIEVSAATVHRWLRRLGISRLRDLDVTGNSHRQIRRIVTERPGQLVHLDVKKIGAIPTGGGWRVHGRGSTQDKAARKERVGYRYWHSAIDSRTRLAFTESLADEKAVTAAGFLRRATTFFAAHGITVERVLTDNGPCYRSRMFDAALPDGARHTFTRPHRPQTNGKVERYNRTLGAEFAYARPWTSETQRADYLQRWLIHYNYHRAHTAIGNQPPATLGPDHCHQRHDAEQLGRAADGFRSSRPRVRHLALGEEPLCISLVVGTGVVPSPHSWIDSIDPAPMAAASGRERRPPRLRRHVGHPRRHLVVEWRPGTDPHRWPPAGSTLRAAPPTRPPTSPRGGRSLR